MISVIVPIYNVEPYLRQCVDSIVAQDFKDVEIILVNDGSTDGSRAICEQYMAENENIVLINKPNGGLSDARNAGTAVAKGDWIFYLDSDDWLEHSALMRLYEFAIAKDCDAVQGGIFYAYSDHLLYRNPEHGNAVMTHNAALGALAKQDVVKNFAWGKLYKTNIAKQFQFPVGKYFEDSYWQYKVMNQCHKYGVVAEPLVYYRQRSNSISGTSNVKMIDLLVGEEEMMQFYALHYPQHLKVMTTTWWNNLQLLMQLNTGNKVVERYYSDSISRNATLLNKELKWNWSYRLKCFPRLQSAHALALRAYSSVKRRLFKDLSYRTIQVK